MVKISPSILSSDYGNLESELKKDVYKRQYDISSYILPTSSPGILYATLSGSDSVSSSLSAEASMV